MTTARNNAELIVQARELGYLRDDWVTVDPTWGLGKFWTLWQPDVLYPSDLDLEKSPSGIPVDFTNMRVHRTGSIDAVVFDPPYKLNGTSTGKGPSASDAGFGVSGAYTSWQERHRLIRDGITDCVRILRPPARRRKGGMLLVKVQDQVCSGQKRWQTREFADHAESLGCRLVDMMHLSGIRKQPEGNSQQHSQINFSTMLVLRRER